MTRPSARAVRDLQKIVRPNCQNADGIRTACYLYPMLQTATISLRLRGPSDVDRPCIPGPKSFFLTKAEPLTKHPAIYYTPPSSMGLSSAGVRGRHNHSSLTTCPRAPVSTRQCIQSGVCAADTSTIMVRSHILHLTPRAIKETDHVKTRV